MENINNEQPSLGIQHSHMRNPLSLVFDYLDNAELEKVEGTNLNHEF